MMACDSDEKWQQRSWEHCESPQPGPLSISANRAPRRKGSGSPQSRKSFHAFVSRFPVLCSTDGTITRVFNLALDSSRKCKFFFNMLRDARWRNLLLKSWLIVVYALWKCQGNEISVYLKRKSIFIYSLCHPGSFWEVRIFLNNYSNVCH